VSEVGRLLRRSEVDRNLDLHVTHVGPVTERVLDPWLELLVRRPEALAEFTPQDLEGVHVRTARLRFLLRVRDLMRADLERGDTDVVIALVIHVLDRDADIPARVMMMDVADGLETRREAPELSPLGAFRVGALQDAEDPLHALRSGGIDIGHFGLELATGRLPLDVQPRGFRSPVPGAVDVVENPVGIGAVAHEDLQGVPRFVPYSDTGRERSKRISAGPEPAKGIRAPFGGGEVAPTLSFTHPARLVPRRANSKRSDSMKKTPAVILTTVMMSACGGGPPAPPSLEYVTSQPRDLTYDYSSETTVSVSMMGQSMELSQEGTATYAVGLTSTGQGVTVRLAVAELDATLSSPIGAPISVDERAIDGTLEFSLDRTGNTTLHSEPQVREEASQLFSGVSLAHGFFPGLPGRAVSPGDQWVDTVSYDGATDTGRRSETTVLTYTVTGDTVIAGRALLVMQMEGTTESEFDINVQGMSVTQSSDLRVEGHVLWDYQGSVMFESRRTASGEGSVRIPLAPGPLPIRIESTERARLQDR